MDIHNIALVRATNVIPFDGTVHPVKDTPFIKKESGSVFAREMFSLLRRKGALKPIDWESPESERQAVEDHNKEIAAEYMPYTSMYNSMVLFSLNGLVPDDNATKFSEKSCAIIDGLEEQIDKADIVSMVPTDTAVKGTLTLSKNAKILIAKERYEGLSQQEKLQLEQLDLTVNVFEGDLKTAVDSALVNSGRYTAENLGLTSENGGFKESPTSKDVLEAINTVAQGKNIPQLLHMNVFLGQTGGEEKLESVKGEKQQCDTIAGVYKQAFLEYLFANMNIDEAVKECALYFPDSDRYMEDLCDEIGRIGLDKYKQVLDEYNQSLEKLRDAGELSTPQQIVDAIQEGRKIDLKSMVEQGKTKDAVLASAIEATEEVTTSSAIKQQEGRLTQIQRGIETKETRIE